MGVIRILDEHIANQIAAGEVVERPSSVVKELVENSIDAGSTRIDVTIEEGGLQLIRIADNGSGMAPDDCKAAFFRHATSKIESGKDLFRIRTLGFRGEALPSIAAVAKVECLTSVSADGLGRRLVIEGGTVKMFEETAARKGTDISVKELFYNTPARLKYMKTIQTELGHVSDYMYRLALAYPNIAFSLKHNSNVLLHSLGNGDLLQVIAAVYGPSLAKGMLPLRGESLDYAITGYLSKPELTRANRSAVSTIVNGRYIRNYALVHALLRAYHTLLPINRYPVAVLRIDMDPSLMDVNVHPSKLEVRFSKEPELLKFVEDQVKQLLHKQVLIPQISGTRREKPAVVQEQLQFYGSASSEQTPESAPLPEAEVNGVRDAGQWSAEETRSPAPGREALGSPASARQPAAQRLPPAPGLPQTAALAADEAAASASGAAPPPPIAPPAAAWRPAPAPGAAPLPPAAASALRRPPAPSRPPAASYSANAASGPGGFAAAKSGRGGAPSADWAALAAKPDSAPDVPEFPRLSPVGQVHGTYIVAQNEEGLFLIDQHAAHERINYEYYYNKFGSPQEASQGLLVPITLEYTPSDADWIKQNLALFEQVGLYLEHFGGHTFLVRAYPHWFPKGDEKQIVEDIAEWVLTEKKSVDLAKLREKSAILCSCKASIKANQSLTLVEIEALLRRLGQCRNPYTCPHGRPIVISFSTYELEKMFKRVM